MRRRSPLGTGAGGGSIDFGIAAGEAGLDRGEELGFPVRGLFDLGRSEGRTLGGFEAGDEIGAPDTGLLETERPAARALAGGVLDAFASGGEDSSEGTESSGLAGRVLGLLVRGNRTLMTSAMFSVAVRTLSCSLFTSCSSARVWLSVPKALFTQVLPSGSVDACSASNNAPIACATFWVTAKTSWGTSGSC